MSLHLIQNQVFCDHYFSHSKILYVLTIFKFTRRMFEVMVSIAYLGNNEVFSSSKSFVGTDSIYNKKLENWIFTYCLILYKYGWNPLPCIK